MMNVPCSSEQSYKELNAIVLKFKPSFSPYSVPIQKRSPSVDTQTAPYCRLIFADDNLIFLPIRDGP